MRYQQINERRAVILMVVLSLLTLFALVGVTFVLYADAEATAARVAREAQTIQTAEVNPKEALAFFLGQLIYDVPDTLAGTGSGLRGHSLARTMYGYNTPGPNFIASTPSTYPPNIYPFSGVGRLHYATPSGVGYPLPTANILTPIRNVANSYANIMDDYALVNYTWFSTDSSIRDPERVGVRANPAAVQTNPYVGVNAPYTYPDLNSFFLAAVRADGTVLTPSYHRPWLFQVATPAGATTPQFFAFNDMSNPNWTNPVGRYLTLRPRPAEHPFFPLPGDATGDVKNLPWAPGGNDSIWVDLGAPVMTAPDGTPYKMMFAPLIMDLDNRINLNTAGNISAYVANMTAPASWSIASQAHVSNQGWGPWEVNLSKVLWGEQGAWTPSTPITPPEWMRLLTGMSYVVPTPPNTSIVQPGIIPFPAPLPNATLSAWLLPGVRGRYLEAAGPVWTPNAPPASILPAFPYAISMATNYPHAYAQGDYNGLNEGNAGATPSSRIAPPGYVGGVLTYPFPNFVANTGYSNGGIPNGVVNALSVEDTNNPALYNTFQSPLVSVGTRAFSAQNMEALLRPNASASGPVNANASAVDSDLLRLCPINFPSQMYLNSLPATPPSTRLMAQRYANMVTTQSNDLGTPGVSPYWSLVSPMVASPNGYYLYPPSGNAAPFPAPPTSVNPPTSVLPPTPSEFGLDWRAASANSSVYFPFSNPATYPSPGARIRLNRPLPPYPHMASGVTPPYQAQPVAATPTATLSPYGMSYNLTNSTIANQFSAAQLARQALANDIYRRLLAIVGLTAPVNLAAPTNIELAPYRWLAQLAVNIVDYIDEDDIMTPFNFYTTLDGLAATSIYQTTTQTPNDDTGTNANDYPYGSGTGGVNATGPNLLYWVYGTELPKVVLNEVLAEAQQINTANAALSSGGTVTERVKVWAELYNTMPAAPATFTQPQDSYRVPLYMTNPAGSGWSGTGYSPYRISISQWTMDQSAPPISTYATSATPAELFDVSQNTLGKAFISGPFPQSTTDTDFSAVIQLSNNLASPAPNPPQTQTPFTVPGSFIPGTTPPVPVTINAGVDPSNYFLVGPTQDLTNYPNDPFVSPGLPASIPVLQTPNMVYTPTWVANPTNPDERSTGLTVMLRRLANPYLPPQPNPALANFNPYVTVDYIPSVALQPSKTTAVISFGKRQPYSSLLLWTRPTVTIAGGVETIPFDTVNSPVIGQVSAGANPRPANVTSTFGAVNNQPTQSGHYDWLVHLDRAPISPMELLHVSAWPPYKLTQRFMLGSDQIQPTATPPVNYYGTVNLSAAATSPSTTSNPPNLSSSAYAIMNGNWRYMYPIPTIPSNIVSMFAHYAPWLDLPPALNAGLPTMSCPWWFDDGTSGLTAATQSHRLYRLFEFLECGDRAFGVNGLGRIPGKVNINTIWDPDVLQALIDANTSMGTATTLPSPPLTYAPINPATSLPWGPAAPADLVSQIFANMMNSRSPNYYGNGAYVLTGTQVNAVSSQPPIGPVNMGTSLAYPGTSYDDRPFMPLSTGLYNGGSPASGLGTQFPNGLMAITDTILRTNNPLETAASTNTYPQTAAGTAAANNYLLFQNYYDNNATAISSAAYPTAATNLVTSAVHPYLQSQLLNKLYNNVTTRSNTFAVFLTVGFFQVMGTVGGIPNNVPQLGPELGRSEGKQVRHRMFAIVDRTNLTTFTTTGQGYAPPAAPPPVTGPTPNASYAATVSVPAAPSPNPTGAQTIQLPLTVTVNPANAAQLLVPNLLTGIPGVIQAGTQLVIDPGNPNEETVTVISVTPPTGPTPALLVANFTLPHGAGGTTFPIVQRGNPGPWLLTPYDPRLDPNVVPYFSIID